MDTITHGLVGALIGKAFFAERAADREAAPRSQKGVEACAAPGPTAPTTNPPAGLPHRCPPAVGGCAAGAEAARTALWAATLGAVLPDADIVFELFDSKDLAIIELHRGFTHSFLCMPFFAAGLAALTRWLARRRGIASPSWGALALIYTLGLASHIVLDLITSFGTMIWSPLESRRVTWDLTFIIDFTMTGIVLLPQVAAWAYRRREGSVSRRLFAWMFFSLAGVAIEELARAVGFGFSPWAVVSVSLLAAAIFYLPARSGWGFAVTRAAWCRAGVYALVAYLGLCAVAHHLAYRRVEAFAQQRALPVENLGALPMPPSLLRWNGLIRTPHGVYEASFSLTDLVRFPSRPPREPAFRFFADAQANGYIEAARRQPAVRTYLWFARFPVIRYFQEGDLHRVEFTDLRFFTRGLRRRNPFTFRVTLDSAGRVLAQGWVN